jgi:hypothetical protein
MDKNKERYENIKKTLDKITDKHGTEHIRISGIDGFNMEDNREVEYILGNKVNLIGKNFMSIDQKKVWKYDGTVNKSFPGLHLNGHHGTKGLTLSNMKAFYKIRDDLQEYEWFCILEDDAVMSNDIYTQMIKNIEDNKSLDIMVFDNRGRGGTSAVLYSKRIIDKVIGNMHPLSVFSIINEMKYKRGSNLWDWKLWSYMDNYKIKNGTFPLVPSGKFPSEIDK